MKTQPNPLLPAQNRPSHCGHCGHYEHYGHYGRHWHSWVGRALPWGLSLLLFAAGTQVAYASSDRICKRWYKQKKFEEASRCFSALYQQLKDKRNKAAEEKERMGASLRNSGLALVKAAEREKSVAKAAYLRERAVDIFDLFIRQRYYLSAAQKQYTIAQRDSLRDKIGYAMLTIIVPSAKSKVHVTGYQFHHKSTGGWSRKLRPGAYSIVVRTQKGDTRVKTVRLEPSVPKVINLAIPKKPSGAVKPTPPRPSLLPWFVLGGGLVVAVVGGSLVGVSFGTKGTRDTQVSLLRAKTFEARTLPETISIKSLHEAANAQLTAGIVLGASGAAIAGVGLVLYFLKQ